MSETPRKPYDPPMIKKLTPESARLLIIRHGSSGDQNTKELLELLELKRRSRQLRVDVVFRGAEPFSTLEASCPAMRARTGA